VDKDGNYIDFPVECYACKQKDIVFYFNATCSKVQKPVECSSCAAVLCPVGSICKDGKCLESPTSKTIKCLLPRPTEKDCPTLQFFREPDPLVCGVNTKGDLIDFPVECYACRQKDIVYYYNSTCDSIESITCAGVLCKAGEKCFGGKCYPIKWPVCEKDAKITKCNKTRPNEKTCPVVNFFVKPQDIVCGVTKTGERISYPVECYACKNTEVEYYFNKSCEYLSSECPSNIKCKLDKDCPKGLSCENKLCIDKCISTTCPVGTECLRGNCIWSHLQPKNCSTIKCKEGYMCVNAECVIDHCKDVYCIATSTCINGKCVPIAIDEDKCTTDKDCKNGFSCQNNVCVDKCIFTTCLTGTTCVAGECIKTVRNCSTIRCKSNYKC